MQEKTGLELFVHDIKKLFSVPHQNYDFSNPRLRDGWAKLDTERLLYVVENDIRDRGCGKTTIALSNVCNHLLLGNPEIYCRIKTKRNLSFILPMLKEIVQVNYGKELRIEKVIKSQSIVITNLGSIEFFTGSLQDYENDWLRGRDGLIVDLVDY